jgi:hypothetical protein
VDHFKMKLTSEEQDTLNGKQGPVMAKALRTIVMYGELFGAERLLPLDGCAEAVWLRGGVEAIRLDTVHYEVSNHAICTDVARRNLVIRLTVFPLELQGQRID